MISPDAKDKFLYGTLVLVNDYKCTKFQLPSCISFKDTVGVPKQKWGGAADLLTRSVADRFLYRALVLVNVYEFVKFSLPNSITFGDTEGCHNKSGDC